MLCSLLCVRVFIRLCSSSGLLAPFFGRECVDAEEDKRTPDLSQIVRLSILTDDLQQRSASISTQQEIDKHNSDPPVAAKRAHPPVEMQHGVGAKKVGGGPVSQPQTGAGDATSRPTTPRPTARRWTRLAGR
jgi:hypothetical protein